MASLYTHSSNNKRKTWLLMSIFFVLVIVVAYVFSVNMNNSSILYVAVGFSFFGNFLAYYNSDKLVLSMTKAKELKPESSLEAKELYRLVENLSITAGLPLPKIYIINDQSPNAFATGRNPEHAVVAVTTGLLERLDRSELEGVIAHELSHIGNRDILLATIATVMVGMIVMLADIFRRWSIFGGNRDNNSSGDNNNKGKLIITVIAIVFSILAPLFAYLLQFAISRKREFVADADAALLTRYPEGLARALEKISSHPKSMDNVNQATAHLFIDSPIKKDSQKGKLNFFAKALMTHPPVEERIAKLRS